MFSWFFHRQTTASKYPYKWIPWRNSGVKNLFKKRLHLKTFTSKDIFTIDGNKVVLSDKVPCSNGKDCHYIVGYQVDGETIIPLFVKTPKNIFNYGVSQYDKNSAYTMSFNVSDAQSGCFSIKTFQMRLSHSYLKTGNRINKRRRQVRPW